MDEDKALEFAHYLQRAIDNLLEEFGNCCEKEMRENVKKLGKYMKGLGFLSLISALGMIIEAVCELALPSLANNIYETVNVATSPEQTKAYVLKMGFGMLGLAVIGLCGGLTTMKLRQ